MTKIIAAVVPENAKKFGVVGSLGQSTLYAYGQFNFHPRAIEVLAKISNIDFKPNDVILTMFPKSGSTWLSECLYLITNNYCYEAALKQSIEYRFPQIDSPTHDVFDMIKETPSSERRLVKSSIPASLLLRHQLDQGAKQMPKVIAIFRNPRDVLVSFYHHCKTVKHYDIDLSFNVFFDLFVTGQVPCGPIWLMYNEMYQYYCQNKPNSMIIEFERMKFNLVDQVKKLCLFLGKPAPADDEAMSTLLDHLSVEKMRENNTINRRDWTNLGLRNENGCEFVRKGTVGDWKNYFTREQSQRFDNEITAKLVPELQAIYPSLNY